MYNASSTSGDNSIYAHIINVSRYQCGLRFVEFSSSHRPATLSHILLNYYTNCLIYLRKPQSYTIFSILCKNYDSAMTVSKHT